MGDRALVIEPGIQRVREISACRICVNTALEPVVDLGSQAIAGLFDDGETAHQRDRPVPLRVVRCHAQPGRAACGFVQLTHTVSPSILYREYGYRSGINTTMRGHLEGLVREIEAVVPLRRGDLVVDIGANDGTTLLAYRTEGMVKVAYEPSNVRPESQDHGIAYIPHTFNRQDFDARVPGRRARVITSIAMFYDVDAPVEFCRDLCGLLADDGVWVIEMSYLGAMLKHHAFDAICHEHLGYYSLGTLQWVARQADLEFSDSTFNEANGGSVRCSLTKRAARTAIPAANRARIARALRDERRRGDHLPESYAQFRAAIQRVRRELTGLLSRMRRQGRRVFGYGASTKGNVLLQYCGIGPRDLVAIADRNPAKVGRTTPGSQIPICSEAQMREARPDYLLILPWHFLDEFLMREQALRASGTAFIVPLPEVRLV